MTEVVATYNPAVFSVRNLADAKKIILTESDDISVEDRWVLEAPYLVKLMRERFAITESSLVLDYGCGVGRVAKVLIAEMGCRVIGVDLSPSMRGLAANYVGSERFCAIDPDMLPILGVKFDAAVAIWALQHVLLLEKALDALISVPATFVAGSKKRYLPVSNAPGEWVDDGLDVRSMMKARFEEADSGILDPRFVGKIYSDESYWAYYRRRA